MINDGCLLSCAETNSDDKGTDMRRQVAPCHQVLYPIYASLVGWDGASGLLGIEIRVSTSFSLFFCLSSGLSVYSS